jgi:hypothetical protein
VRHIVADAQVYGNWPYEHTHDVNSEDEDRDHNSDIRARHDPGDKLRIFRAMGVCASDRSYQSLLSG